TSGSVLSGSNSPPPARTPAGARTRGMRLNVGAGSSVAEPPPWELHRYGSDLRPSVPTNWSPGPSGELIRQRGFRPSLLFLPGSPHPPTPVLFSICLTAGGPGDRCFAEVGENLDAESRLA